MERSRRAASAVAGAFALPSQGQRKGAALPRHPLFQSREKQNLAKNLVLRVGAKFGAERQLQTGPSFQTLQRNGPQVGKS